MKYSFLYLFLLTFSLSALGQSQKKTEYDPNISRFTLGVSYAMQFPGADLADRFGWNSNIGGSFTYKNPKNLLFSAEGSFIFGTIINEKGVLNNISTTSGNIIGVDGRFADIRFYERGYYLNASFGKLFSVLKGNGSGVYVKAGGGFLEHKFRIEVIGNNVPQLNSEYQKGYDRLTNGFFMSQSAGFMYLSNTRYINFFIGLESIQAFTKNRRAFNFDTMEKDNKARLDMLYGLRAGWIILLYKRKPDEFYYR